MKISYTLQSQDGNRALVMILPEHPINGFHGVDLLITVPEKNADAFIRERVVWKIRQEIGNTDVEIVKG